MAGKVYTYNLYSEPSTLSLNSGAAGEIPANGGSTGSYLPAGIAVDSASHSDEASGKWYRGGDGINTIRIQWDSGYSTSSTFAMPNAKDNVSLDDDLIVYIARNTAFVQTTRGFIVETNELEFHEVG